MSDEVVGATRALAERLVALRTSPPPQHVLARARHCLLDWTGVTVAGVTEDAGRIAGDLALDEAADGPCTLVGRPGRTTAQLAALANGVASHALDFDDGSSLMMGHPSVAVVPAALAVAEGRGASGRDLVTATVAGIEAASVVGVLVGKSHYVAGWHGTATIGTFGAAAAAAHLLNLDVPQTQHALGLAATQAAGLKAMFGTMGKPFHAGRAAMSGVLAAQLAARGFTVNPDAIEAEQGFASTGSTTFDPAAPARELDDGERYGVEAVSFKHHACCGGTHPTIDTLTRLRRQYDLTVDDIEDVRLRVSPLIAGMCAIEDPASGLEGKFSIRYCAALALAGRGAGPQSFEDAAVQDPDIRELMARIATESIDGDWTDVELEVRLRDGRTVRATAESSSGETAGLRHLDGGELRDEWTALAGKFDLLVTPRLGAEVAAELVGLIDALDDQPSLTALTNLLQPRAELPLVD